MHTQIPQKTGSNPSAAARRVHALTASSPARRGTSTAWPQAEASTAWLQAEASSAWPQAGASLAWPQAEASSAWPQAEASSAWPQAEASSAWPQAEASSAWLEDLAVASSFLTPFQLIRFGEHGARRERGVKHQVSVFFDGFGPSRGCWRGVLAQGDPAVGRWDAAEAFLAAVAGFDWFYFSIVVNKRKLTGPGFKFKESFYK
jgi:hypothetical protein